MFIAHFRQNNESSAGTMASQFAGERAGLLIHRRALSGVAEPLERTMWPPLERVFPFFGPPHLGLIVRGESVASRRPKWFYNNDPIWAQRTKQQHQQQQPAPPWAGRRRRPIDFIFVL